MIRTKYDVVAITVARVFLGGYFVIEGLDKFANMTSSRAVVEAVNIPVSGSVVALFAIMQIVLGFMMVIRFHTRIVSILLAVYVLISTVIMNLGGAIETHSFERVVLYKDIAIFGGLLFIHAHSRGFGLFAQSNEDKIQSSDENSI